MHNLNYVLRAFIEKLNKLFNAFETKCYTTANNMP